VTATLKPARESTDLALSYAQGRQRAWLFAEGVVDSEEQGDEGTVLHVTWTPAQKARFAKL
jgi:GTPase